MAPSLPELVLQVAVDRSGGQKFITSYGRPSSWRRPAFAHCTGKRTYGSVYAVVNVQEKDGMNSDLMGGGGHIYIAPLSLSYPKVAIDVSLHYTVHFSGK